MSPESHTLLAAGAVEQRATDTAIKTGRAPFGFCECREGCTCAVIAGPAAFSASRNGASLKICTRCCLPDDGDRTLLINGDTSMAPFTEYDALGAVWLAFLVGLDEERGPRGGRQP